MDVLQHPLAIAADAFATEARAHRKPAQAGATKVRRQRLTDLDRFELNVAIARSTVDELVRRGAVVVAVRSALVTLRRSGQIARIDAWGRVEWAH